MYNPFMYCWIQFLSILLSIFASISTRDNGAVAIFLSLCCTISLSHCCFVSQLKQNKTEPSTWLAPLATVPFLFFPLQKISWGSYAHTPIPLLLSFLTLIIFRLYPQLSTKTTLVQVTNELFSISILFWLMYQQCMLQLVTPPSFETLFIQLRDPTHS